MRTLSAAALSLMVFMSLPALAEEAKQKLNLEPDAVARKNAPGVAIYCALMPAGSLEVRASNPNTISHNCKVTCEGVKPGGEAHKFSCGANIASGTDQIPVCQDLGPFEKLTGGSFGCE